MELIGVSISAARHVGEIGFLIGALGALVFIGRAVNPGLFSSKPIGILGLALLLVAFVLGILYVHWV